MQLSSVFQYSPLPNFYTINGTRVSNNYLKDSVTLDPGSTLVVSHGIYPPRQASNLYELISVSMQYQILSGNVTSLTPTLSLVTYTAGSGDTTVVIPTTSSGFATTVGTQLIGTLTVVTPTYIVPSNGTVYRFDLSLAIDTSAAGSFTFSSVDTLFNQYFPPAVLSSFMLGNVARVDPIYGNDTTGTVSGTPFASINGAITAINSGAITGAMILLHPGTYNETLTLPASTVLRGMALGNCIVQQANVASNTDLVTMGEHCVMEEVLLNLTTASSAVTQLRGVVMPGTTTQTSKLLEVVMSINNATVTGGSTNIYGIHSTGTGIPSSNLSTAAEVSITVTSNNSGNKRGIYIDSQSQVNLLATNITVTGSTGSTGSYIGFETINNSALIQSKLGIISGLNADISQTSGSISLGLTKLQNYNANNLYFTSFPQTSNLTWADLGSIPSGTSSFYRIGSSTLSSTEIFTQIANNSIVKGLVVQCSTGPGTGLTATWTVRKNGVNTNLTASLTGSAIATTNNTASVFFSAGSLISLMVTTQTGDTTTNSIISVEIY